jgi:hypothetical protein
MLTGLLTNIYIANIIINRTPVNVQNGVLLIDFNWPYFSFNSSEKSFFCNTCLQFEHSLNPVFRNGKIGIQKICKTRCAVRQPMHV